MQFLCLLKIFFRVSLSTDFGQVMPDSNETFRASKAVGPFQADWTQWCYFA